MSSGSVGSGTGSLNGGRRDIARAFLAFQKNTLRPLAHCSLDGAAHLACFDEVALYPNLKPEQMVVDAI